MAKTLEFYFDFGSPTAYLAYKRLNQLKETYGLDIEYKPMLLGGIFKATGNMSPVMIPTKGKYMMMQDLPRFVKRYGVDLNFNPNFPINTLPLMRGALAAMDLGCFDAYAAAVFDAVWVDAKNMGDPAVIAEVLAEADLDVEALLAKSQEPAIKQALITATEEATGRDIFGAPTMFIDDQMFFGQDRLDFVEELLQAS